MGSPAGKNLRYAGFWVRTWASLIDSVIVGILTIPPLVYIYGLEYLTDPNTPAIAGVMDFLISFILPAALVIWFWSKYQATPGKLVFQTSIRDAQTGQPPTMRQMLIRYVGYFVSLIPLLLGIIK